MNKETTDTSRRQFVMGAAAAALAGCSPPAPENAPASGKADANTLYGMLSKRSLRGQDGEVVSVSALEKANSGKFSTLSFSFMGCGNGFCPLTNQKLASLGNNDNVVHYVVNLNPDLDGGFTKSDPGGKSPAAQSSRESFAGYVRAMGVKGKIEFLYPANTEEAKHIQNDAGMITNLNANPQDHASMIALFAPGGKKLDVRNGVTEDLSGWIDTIRQTRGRQ